MNYRLFALLERVLGPGIPTSGANVAFNSPFCVHYKKKLEINLNTVSGKNPWHCWISNERGRTIYSLFKKIKVDKKIYKELEECIDVIYSSPNEILDTALYLPNEFISLSNISKNNIKNKNIYNALLYLHSRGISAIDIKRYNIGMCETGDYKDKIIIPSYDKDGKLNYFIGRSIYNSKFKYKGPPVSKNVVAFEMYINWKLPIFLVEGVFDAISARFNAIPLLGKTVSTSLMQAIIDNKPPAIYVALDSDAATDSLFICKKFLSMGLDVYNVSLNKKDPSELGYQNFFELCLKSQLLTNETLIKMEIML